MFKAVIFDLDGVVTKTALVHANAWKMVFDEYLQSREHRFGEAFNEFIYERDYLGFVDGKPRYQGVADFLCSRKIELPFGSSSDSTEVETVCGIGNRKNYAFNHLLKTDGVDIYQSTVSFINELISRKVRIGLASSSKNAREVLAVTGLLDLFETIVDGMEADKRGLKGKPCGDIFINAAKDLSVLPRESVVVEDAVSGVQAAVNGKIGFVLGIARERNQEVLAANGADKVVSDMADITVLELIELFNKKWSL
jgi:beta-phosphoglucomutase family hydrolase